jgi:hypothetical protein
MADSRPADDPRLIALAQSMADGEAVDWTEVAPIDDPETAAAIEELRALDPLVRWGDPIPDHWGPFPISGEVGRGAFGTVYRAFDPELNTEIALKVIQTRSIDDAEANAQALNEARLLVQVTHPNVVRVYRVTREDDEIGIAMELVRGHTLHQIVRRDGRFDADDAARIGIGVCRALAAVHAAGIVHGDVKAQNVMLAVDGRIILMDFGAGADLKRDTSHRGSGTPLYMAPEVIAGGRPTTMSDVYSLGVLLYFLVTGTYPIEGDSLSEVERAHERRGARRPLAHARADLPGGFVKVVEKASSLRVADRHDGAAALETELQRGIESGWRKWWFQKPLWAAAAFAAVLTLGAGLAYWLPQGPAPIPPGVQAEKTPAPAPGSPTAPTAYRVEAAMYRFDNGTDVRLAPGARVATDDRLSMQLRSSVPLYVYVVNEDEQGESWLLFPIPGRGLTNPLPAGVAHRLPGVLDGQETYWQVTSVGGREHFVLFASPDPPAAAFKKVFDALPPPSFDAGVAAQRLPPEAASVLRGVGGLAPAPTKTVHPRVRDDSYASLSGVEEETRGPWIRQITFENRGR